MRSEDVIRDNILLIETLMKAGEMVGLTDEEEYKHMVIEIKVLKWVLENDT